MLERTGEAGTTVVLPWVFLVVVVVCVRLVVLARLSTVLRPSTVLRKEQGKSSLPLDASQLPNLLFVRCREQFARY